MISGHRMEGRTDRSQMSRISRRRAGCRLAAAICLMAAVAAPTLVGGGAPALAQSSDFFAYAGGKAVSPMSCPQTSAVSAECTLAQALALVPAGGSVLLATPGSAGYFYGNYMVA